MGQVQFPFDSNLAISDPNAAGAALNYQTGLQALQYRQALAENLLKQGQAPYSSGVGAGGVAYRVSPLEGLAHALSSGLGAYQMQNNVDQTKQLAQQYGNALMHGAGQSPSPASASGAAPNTVPSGSVVQGNNTGAPAAPASSGVASVRNNNPGAMWPGPVASQFGATGAQNLQDGQGNKIATFPDAVSGAAAHFALLAKNYAGMPLSAAIHKWSGGNSSAQYTQSVANATGIAPTTVLTPQLLASPQGVELAKAMARQEAGGEYPLSQDGWQQAQARVFGGGVNPASAKMQDRLSPDGQGSATQASYPQPASEAPGPPQPPVPSTASPQQLGAALQAPQHPWSIPGVDDAKARYEFGHDHEQWAKWMGEAIRANAPTPEQKNLTASGKPLDWQQQQLALASQKNAGTFDPSAGTQLVQTPGGLVAQEIPGAAEARAHAEALKSGAVAQAGSYAKKQEHFETNASNAQAELPQLQLLSRVLKDKNFYSGWRADSVEQMSSAAKTLRLSDGETASLMQIAKKLGSAGSLENIQEMAQYGAVRVPEMHMIEKSNMDINNTPAANAAVVEVRMRLAQRNIDVADMANAYANAHGGQIDRNFEQMLRDYYKNKPLFSADEIDHYNGLLSGKPAPAKAPAKAAAVQQQSAHAGVSRADVQPAGLSPAAPEAASFSRAEIEAEMRRRGHLQ